MMMSRKDFLKGHILSWQQKVYSDWEDVTSSDRAFQVFGPATRKAFDRENSWHGAFAALFEFAPYKMTLIIVKLTVSLAILFNCKFIFYVYSILFGMFGTPCFCNLFNTKNFKTKHRTAEPNASTFVLLSY